MPSPYSVLGAYIQLLTGIGLVQDMLNHRNLA